MCIVLDAIGVLTMMVAADLGGQMVGETRLEEEPGAEVSALPIKTRTRPC